MNQQKSDKLKALIEKGKWSYVFKYGVLGWVVSTAIFFSAIGHFTDSRLFIESIFISLVVFPVGGLFWGYLCGLSFLVNSVRWNKVSYNKQILSPANSAGCDANRVRGRRAKFGR